MTFYNEIDPYPASWLENLIAQGHLPAGEVSRASITDLLLVSVPGKPSPAHFFAGLGGWPYALRLAGIPDSAPIWTGSCPCQPFSQSGRKKGFTDDRHLWPAWFKLIRECRPPVIFGEQVASPDGLAWLDLVSTDLEDAGYTVGAADLCAAGIGAPHLRQRLYFVAYSDGEGRELLRSLGVSGDGEASRRDDADGRGEAGVGFASRGRFGQGSGPPDAGRLGDPGAVSPTQGEPDESLIASANLGGRVGHPDGAGREIRERASCDSPSGERLPIEAVPLSFWSDCDWIPCHDPRSGKIIYRPVEPGSFPLAHRTPNRVGRLRAYGNAIVPQVAAAFVRAAIEACE